MFFIPPTYSSPTSGIDYALTNRTISFLDCYDSCINNNMTLASVPEEDRKGVVATFSRESPKVPRWWIAVYKDPFRDWSSIDGSEVEAKWADVYYKKSCDEGCVFQHGGEMDPPGTWGKEDCAEEIRCLCSSGPTSDATFEWSLIGPPGRRVSGLCLTSSLGPR